MTKRSTFQGGITATVVMGTFTVHRIGNIEDNNGMAVMTSLAALTATSERKAAMETAQIDFTAP